MKRTQGKVKYASAGRPRRPAQLTVPPSQSSGAQTTAAPQQHLRELQRRVNVLEAQNDDLRRVRDEAIAALQASEMQAHNLLETSPDFICTFGMDRIFTDVNNAGARNFGYASKHDFIGRDILEFTAKRSYADALRIMQANIKQGVVYNEPIYILNRQGEEVPVEICGRLVKNPTGQPTGFVVTLRDVTERKKTKAALQHSEATLQSLINGHPESLFLIDTKGIILAANAIMARRLGRSVAEVMGACIDDLLPAAVANPRRARVEEVIRTGLPTQFEDLRGGRYFASHMSPVLNDAGQVFRIAILAQDITERKQNEAALRSLTGQLLQSQDEERRRIARELHDTTAQKLVGLLFGLNSLKKQLADPGQAVLAESMSVTKQCIDEIRTLSFLLHPPQLDHFGLAGAIQDFTREFARRSGLEINLELHPEPKRLAPEHELALLRILQEALWNIYRHSGSRTATVRLAKNQGEIRLEVADAGHGMPVPKGGRTGVASTPAGVGLHGMHERLRYLGGRLEIQTGTTGTTLTAIVPLRERAAKEPKADAQ